MRAAYPILEFDEDKKALIRPQDIITAIDIAEHCVLCFFSEAIAEILKEYKYQVVATIKSESAKYPLYELGYQGKKIVLVQAAVGAPMAAGLLEELVAYGCRKYLVCGSCGTLDKDLVVGHLVVPTAALRDEGTSYHYLKPAREVETKSELVEKVCQGLSAAGLPHLKAKTWTTDAFYRETAKKVAQRKAEGCLTVEMEAAAFLAVAQYLGVGLAIILYSGDNLDGEKWEARGFLDRYEIRKALLETSLDICLSL